MKTYDYCVTKDGECVRMLKGRYGRYARFYGEIDHEESALNISEKSFPKYGCHVETLTPQEAEARNEARRRAIHEREVQAVAEQMRKCLETEPVELPERMPRNSFYYWVSIAKLPMGDNYHGCGEGYAYVRDNKIYAFTYGNHRQAWEGATYPARFSSYEIGICFTEK